jgi:hypothetical protein
MVRAKVHSLGGLVFIGALILIGILLLNALYAWAFHPVVSYGLATLFIFIILFSVDGLSERLACEAQQLVFDSWFRRERRLSLKGVRRIQFVHEGLNMEQGIESVRVQYRNGEETCVALGPFWHRHQVLAFLKMVIRSTDSDIALEEWR